MLNSINPLDNSSFIGKRSTCPYIKHAMDKYGRENFEMNPILTFKAINKKVCTKVLKLLEVFYIAKKEHLIHKKDYWSYNGPAC